MLSEMKVGAKGVVERFDCDEELTRRLMEMGFSVGTTVEVAHRGPVGGDPIAVRVKGALVGIGRNEARHIVIRESQP